MTKKQHPLLVKNGHATAIDSGLSFISADLQAADVYIKSRLEMISDHKCNHTAEDTSPHSSVNLLQAAVKRWPQ